MTVALALPARLDNNAAEDLQAALLAHRGTELRLDASHCTVLGGLVVQVLASAARTWTQDGVQMTLEAVPAALEDRLRLLGLTPDVFRSGAGPWA